MSVHVLSWAWKLSLGDPKAKLVLLKLADCANDDGVCWPSFDTIARDTELSRSSVIRRIKLLEQLGFLTREYRRKGERADSNLYRLIPKRQSVTETPSSKFQNAGVEGVPGTLEPSEPSGPPSPNGSGASGLVDDLWKAIEAEGIIAPAAKSPRASFAKLVRELADVAVTADEVHRAAVAYRSHEKLGRAMLTLPALAKWMPQMLAESRPKEDLSADRLRKRMAEVLG